MPKLYLIPNTLSEEAGGNFLAGYIATTIKDLRLFFVEEPKSARALLRKLSTEFPLTEAKFVALNEHTSAQEVEEELGKTSAGVISEAGYPAVADPGADLVRLAHERGIEVVPLMGASSIILALAASGLNGQSFAFNGYLPKDKDERFRKIKTLEQRSGQEKQTQIVMETPYRNQSLLEDLLNTCSPRTLLCIAADITGKEQMIKTITVGEWKKKVPQLVKKPTLFLLLYI